MATKFWTFNPALSTLLPVRGSKWEEEKGEWYWLFKVHLCSSLSHELQSAIKSRARAQRTKYYYILYKVLGQVFLYDSMQSINYTCSPHMWGSYDYNQHIHSNIARHTNVFCTHIHFFSVQQSCYKCICTTCQKIWRRLLKILAVTLTFKIWSSGNQEKFFQSHDHFRHRIWSTLWNFHCQLQ